MNRDTIPICNTEAIDGINYDTKSHTVYCTTKTVTQFGEDSYHQRWYDTPATLNEKVRLPDHGKDGSATLRIEVQILTVKQFSITLQR